MTKQIEKRLVDFISAATVARAILSQLHGLEISGLDVQNALCSVLGIDPLKPTELLEKQLTTQQIVDHLRAFNFKALRPDVLTELELSEGIIPEGTPRLLTEKTVAIKGEVWTVYKNDADPWPSNPHAHNYDARLKLHLGSGELFDHNRKCIGKIKKKKLKALREELSAFRLPPLTR